MKTPGTLLQEKRELRGLSIADVAAMTRIPKAMLEHLENDRYDEYVAEVFVRGHLRNYARELRMDTEVVMQAYERHIHTQGSRQVVEEPKFLPLRARISETPRTEPQAAGNSAVSATSSVTPWTTVLASSFQRVKPTHLVAVGLILFALLVMVSFLTGSRATAQDPATFPAIDEKVWEIEQDIEQTRWLLEQPSSAESRI